MDNITNFIQNNEYLIPSSYEEKSKTNIIIDNKSYILIRFIRKDKRNNLLLGEHFSLIINNDKDGTWFWVVVSGDGHVIIFERDIIWINFPGHRKTEKWLHDSWYLEKINKKKIK